MLNPMPFIKLVPVQSLGQVCRRG